MRSSVLSLDFAGQLRHTDTSLSVKADASYKMPSIGSHNVSTTNKASSIHMLFLGYKMPSIGSHNVSTTNNAISLHVLFLGYKMPPFGSHNVSTTNKKRGAIAERFRVYVRSGLWSGSRFETW